MWYLLLEPLMYSRWSSEFGGGLSDSTYFSYLRFRGEWMVSYSASLNLSVPMLFPLHRNFSLSDIQFGFAFAFADRNRMDLSVFLPTGILSSKYPGIELEYRRVVKVDSTYALYGRGVWYFVAASDEAERSFYNKLLDRHAYKHMSFEVTYVRRVGETAFWKASVPLDYAYSMNEYWGGLTLGFGLFPFAEFDVTYWPAKPRPHLFMARLGILIPMPKP